MAIFSDLPNDILYIIFDKIGSYDILHSAQFVCRCWYALSFDPQIWRRINAYNLPIKKDLRVAVDRSAGGLVEFDARGVYVDVDELIFVLKRSPLLRTLTFKCDDYLIQCGLEEVFETASMYCPLLKDIGIYAHILCKDDIEYIGNLFPNLEKFRLERQSNIDGSIAAIARTMGGLVELQLAMYDVENDDFHAILDGCPRIQFLGVITETYSNSLIDDRLKKRLKRIKACEIYDKFDNDVVPLFKHGKAREWVSEIYIY